MAAERYLTDERTSIEVYGGGTRVEGTLRNLSATGAKIVYNNEAPAFLKIGDLIQMTVHLPAINKSHKLSAEVVWKNADGTGVSFLTAETLYQRFVDRTNSISVSKKSN